MTRVRSLVIACTIACAFVVSVWTSAFATPAISDDPLSLVIEFQMNGTVIPGGRFDLYRVGDMDAEGCVTLLPELAEKYAVGSSTSRKGWARLAREMAEQFATDGTEVLRSSVTNDEGEAVLAESGELEQAVYLVAGHDTKVGDKVYTSLPFLVSLPMWDDETSGWVYDVHASPKVNVRSEDVPSDPDGRNPVPEPEPEPGKDSVPDSGTGTGTWPQGSGTTTRQASVGGASELLIKTGDFLLAWWPYLAAGLATVSYGTWRLKRSE